MSDNNNNNNGDNNNDNNDQASTSGTQSGGSSTSATFTSIPQTAAAGGLSFTNPATSSSAFFKIASNEPITIGWNFTGLYVTPTHLTVSAICSQNGVTYPVGPTDGVIDGTATEVIWDVYDYQQSHPEQPLAVATYTLTMWDDRGPTAARSPGFFAPNGNLQFALYTPNPYTPLASGWTCASCSGAEAALTAHPALVSLFATFFIMLISGWGLLRHP